jgi:phage terminase large subunit GpA-like protein
MNARTDAELLLDPDLLAAGVAAFEAMLVRVWREWAPKPSISMIEWAETHRFMSTEETAIKGRYSSDVTPALKGILKVISNPRTRKVVTMKSAQAGYTAGVVCNVMGYYAHYRPSVQVAVFPRAQSAKDFAAEKFDPMVRSTPVLSRLISLKSRAAGNSNTRKHFAGGMIKLVGANSPSDVKSTSARVLIVEEPDDVSVDVKGQGDAIKLAEERTKTYDDHLILIGGTPTAKGASSIEAEFLASTQRYMYVPCHHCEETHVLDWANVNIPKDDDGKAREIFGQHRWEDARYGCPHCGSLWTDDERVANIRRGEWVASCQSHVEGFHHPELLSAFSGSRIPILARKYLEAKHKESQGDPGELVAFWNSTLALPWEYRGELPEEDELRARAETYAEWTCPAGGLVPLMNVDVQHDRLAVTVWVVGRGEEMWLAYWGEIYGQTVVSHAGAWEELEALMGRTVRHEWGIDLGMAGVGIDCGDGQTSDASYAFVRRHDRSDRPVLALKGASDAEGKIEIWAPPRKSIDPNSRGTKAEKWGIQIHVVGAAKAKDLILGWAQEAGRVRLVGAGPGRMHWYESVRPDFYEQLLSEIKIPSRLNPKKRVWKERTDRRNEVLDCTTGAVYLCRHLRLHLRRPVQWDLLELQLRQAEIRIDDQSGPELGAEIERVTPEAADYRSLLDQLRRDRRDQQNARG